MSSKRGTTQVTRVVFTCLVATTAVAAQEPRFDVETLKRNTSGSTSTSMDNRPDGGVVMINGTLRNLIFNAYRPQNGSELEGAPDWLRDRYDLIAEGPGPTTLEQRAPSPPAISILVVRIPGSRPVVRCGALGISTPSL